MEISNEMLRLAERVAELERYGRPEDADLRRQRDDMVKVRHELKARIDILEKELSKARSTISDLTG